MKISVIIFLSTIALSFVSKADDKVPKPDTRNPVKTFSGSEITCPKGDMKCEAEKEQNLTGAMNDTTTEGKNKKKSGPK